MVPVAVVVAPVPVAVVPVTVCRSPVSVIVCVAVTVTVEVAVLLHGAEQPARNIAVAASAAATCLPCILLPLASGVIRTLDIADRGVK